MLWVLHKRVGANRGQKGAANTLEPELQEVVRGWCRSHGKNSVPSKSNTNSAEPAVQSLKLCPNRSCWLGLGGFFFSLNSFEVHFILSVSSFCLCPFFSPVPSVLFYKKDQAKECIIFLFLGYGLDGHNQCERSGRLHFLHWKHTVERAWTLELNIVVPAQTQSTSYLSHWQII